MSKLLWTVMGLSAALVLAQATEEQPVAPEEPATQPAQSTTQPAAPASLDAERTLDRMLRARPGTARPIEPMSREEATPSRRQRAADVAPRTPDVPLKREGDLIVQRVGRLHEMEDGSWEFRFESDRRKLYDPPMVVLPNQRLAQMEAALSRGGGDLRFQVTGMVTQYRGRNYLLIEKAAEVVTDHEGL